MILFIFTDFLLLFYSLEFTRFPSYRFSLKETLNLQKYLSLYFCTEIGLIKHFTFCKLYSTSSYDL